MDAVGIDRCTCFVRNIAPGVNEEQLTDLFGQVGPVKNAFIIGSKGSEVHKGYGFVTFALPDDAKAAITKLSNHTLAGKRLQVQSTPTPPRLNRKLQKPSRCEAHSDAPIPHLLHVSHPCPHMAAHSG